MSCFLTLNLNCFQKYYGQLSTSTLKPCGNSTFSYFSPNEAVLANCLWFNAHLGTGLYLFSRRHLSSAPPQYRILYSVYGSVIFNFGAVLFWATSKAILPKCSTLRSIVGIGSGLVLLLVGKKYLNYVDEQLTNNTSEE